MRSELPWELVYADDLAKWTLHVQIGPYPKQNGVMAEDLKVYEAIIIPALAYVCECWAMKVNNKMNIATTEVRMLRGILGVLRRDHMRNNDIRHILHLSRTMLYSAVFVGLDMSREDMRTPSPAERWTWQYQVLDDEDAQEDMAPTYQGRHDGCECYPCRQGPRPEGVEKKDKTDP